MYRIKGRDKIVKKRKRYGYLYGWTSMLSSIIYVENIK